MYNLYVPKLYRAAAQVLAHFKVVHTTHTNITREPN